MSYWDSSALAALLRPEVYSVRARRLFKADDAPATNWIALIEVLATIGQWRREKSADPTLSAEAARRWREIRGDLTIIPASDPLVSTAEDLLTRHALRGMDAIHLASWLAAQAAFGSGVMLVSFDHRMRDAAKMEGATVLPVRLPRR